MSSSNADAAEVARLVTEHSGLSSTADLSAIIGHAAAIAAETFVDGSPSAATVEDAIQAGVRAGLSVLPVDLPKPARRAISHALVAALGWVWRELQPAVLVEAGESELTVEIVDPEPEPEPEPETDTPTEPEPDAPADGEPDEEPSG